MVVVNIVEMSRPSRVGGRVHAAVRRGVHMRFFTNQESQCKMG